MPALTVPGEGDPHRLTPVGAHVGIPTRTLCAAAGKGRSSTSTSGGWKKKNFHFQFSTFVNQNSVFWCWARAGFCLK